MQLNLDANGMLEFSASGCGRMKLMSCQAEEEQAHAAAPAASYCGSGAPRLDTSLTSRDTLESTKVDVATKVIDCKAQVQTFDASSGDVGDALRAQGKAGAH